MGWYNFKTQQYEENDTRVPELEDTKAREYIPQDAAAQGLYGIYRQHMGLSVADTMIKVLSACLGQSENEE